MNELVARNGIAGKIYQIRGAQVMLDSDLAELYGVETKNLNRVVTRNIERFPKEFRFQLTKEEHEHLRFQNGTSSLVSQSVIPEGEKSKSQNATSSGAHGGRRYPQMTQTCHAVVYKGG